MTREQERIALAERMGWLNIKGWTESPMSGKHPYDRWYRRGEDKQYDYLPFNPFTDANDDYAVLRWLREHHEDLWIDTYVSDAHEEAALELEAPTGDYHIGDYARVALKLLENSND